MDGPNRYWKSAGVAHKIDIVLGDALASLDQLAAAHEKFDCIFIDANKTGYTDYYRAIMNLDLLSADGIILAVSRFFFHYEPKLTSISSEGQYALQGVSLCALGNSRHTYCRYSFE